MNSIQYACSLATIPGNVLEFGVCAGNSMRDIVNVITDRKIFGFDSFEGLPEDWEGTVCKAGFFTNGGNIPDIQSVKFYKGWFDSTVPQYVNENKDDISVLHIDCDLYSSTRTVMYALNEFIKAGTIICFDEFIYRHADGSAHTDHEQKCFYEWVTDFNREFEFIEFNDETPCGFERRIVKILK